MPFKLASSLALAALNALVDAFDTGTPASSAVVYSGTVPASVTDALSGNTVLATLALPDPAFGAAVDEATVVRATLEAVATVQATASGVASFFRFLDGAGTVIAQGTVTAAGGGGDMIINDVDVVEGGDVRITAFSLTFPKG